MSSLSRRSCWWGAIAAVALVAACDDFSSRNPAQPSTPAATSLEVVGPASIPPGQSAQYVARVRLADGTFKNSPNAIWTSNNSSSIRIAPSGVATAQALGEARIEATVTGQGGTRRGSREIVVLPSGTFRLVGFVRDAEVTSIGVPGARVEVTPGSLVTTTDDNGHYRLYGVPPAAEVRVTRTGYQTVVQSLQLTTNAARDFQLPLDGPRLSLNGPYTLAIDVAGVCTPGPLSTDQQHRRYDAVLSQNGSRVDVRLTEPRFRVDSEGRGNHFTGQVNPAGATFTLAGFTPYYYYYYYYFATPDVVERLPGGSLLVPAGGVVMSGTAAELTGQMSIGSVLARYDGFTFPSPATVLGSCDARSQIVFTLTPR